MDELSNINEEELSEELKNIISSRFPLVRTEINVGWIGTGKIGNILASNLISGGYDSMYVYNRTVKKTEPLQEWGANLAEDIKMIADKTNFIFITVGTTAEVSDIFYGKKGLLENLKVGTIIVDMTTGSPTLSKKLNRDCLNKQCFYLDAPIIGNEETIKNKKGSMVVGGNREVYKGMLPIFFALCNSVNYCGLSGNGQNTKLSNQIIISMNMIGIVESLLYSYKAGLDINITIHSLAVGTASSWCFSNYTQKIEERNFNDGLYVKYFVNDLETVLNESYKLGLALPGLSLAKQLFLALKAQGNELKGIHSLILALESLNNTRIEKKIVCKTDISSGIM
ncbi:3-hydroxyisobutyrate dehydrogenase [Piromyces finnis]|uniref:3-hydroxyisobutyrate dehydrogenase n=1 Tax=Piromyces finnis TaxID=1754191 RepID=A0A1Y1VI78_9FUNG|nr:3-hydroxyisobutyrate dehydrogenase [Piromyces finnis]|eukprot:ORX55491.1 3-hydroxyisobutyrate dehydrogenase [Piromyces finnis]